MVQMASTLVSFLTIPILMKLKLKLSYTLFISAGILSLFSGLGLKALRQVVLNIFILPSSRTMVLTVMMVSILGGLMKYYKILDRAVEAMFHVIRDKRKVLMLIPAMAGMLPIPGGALISAPFIDDIGRDMGIAPSRRAAINLVFRHIAMFILPYTTSLLLITTLLPDINIFILILLNLIFIAFVILFGNYFFLKDIKLTKVPPNKNRGKDIKTLLLYTSPIYTPVIISGITGLDFYITLIGSVFIVYLLGDKKDFFKLIFKSINWDTILVIITVLIIKGIILNMEGLLQLFTNLLDINRGIPFMIFVLLLSSWFFGIITGSQTAALAVIIPMLSQTGISGKGLYIYIYFVFGSAFIGYFFSPLHLCQAFTLEYMHVPTSELYKEYKYYMPLLLLMLIVSMLILKLVFLN